MKKFLAALCLLIIFPSNADALALKGVLTGDLASPTGTSTSGKLGVGLGALLETDAAPGLALEFGALLINRRHSISALAVETTTNRRALEIPLALRLSLPIVSVGGGVYYDIGLGDVSTEAGSRTTNTTYATLRESSTGYGAFVSAALDVPVAPGLGLLVDARYKLDLADRDETSGSLRFNGLQVLAGARMGF